MCVLALLCGNMCVLCGLLGREGGGRRLNLKNLQISTDWLSFLETEELQWNFDGLGVASDEGVV